MSSHDKDPSQKQDTSSESSEIDEAEEDLGHLKIEERATKEAKDETKPPNRKGVSTSKLDLLNEPTPGPSGYQEPRQVVLNEPVAGPSGLQKEKKVKAKGIEHIGARMKEEESDRSGESIDVLEQRYRDVVGRFMDQQSSSSGLSLESSSSRRSGYASDSASTSADVSEIRSEMADGSREGSVYRDAPEDFLKEESPSFASALETQPSSEASDTNISDIQDFVPPLTPGSRSVSISTNTGEQGNQAYIDLIRREAAARGSLISTSSGIASTDQSELAHQQDWILAGEMGSCSHDVNDPNRDISDKVAEGAEPLLTSESIEDEPNLDQQMQDFDRLFEQEQPNVEEMIVPEDERGAAASRSQVKRAVPASGKGAGSLCKRKRPQKCPSDPVISELEAIENPRPKHKPIAGKKSKMGSSKSRPLLQSSSESPEPKRSSSEELHRRESPDIKSSSGSQEISETRRSEKLLQLRQHAMSSMDPVEAEDRTSPLRKHYPGSMETEDPTPDTITEKGDEGAAEITEASEAKPSTESTDQAYGSETDGTSKEHEESFEDLGFERSVEKSKRDPKLSNSSPSDEKPDSSAPKAETSRPKRARSEKQSESTSSSDVSDHTASADENDTQS